MSTGDGIIVVTGASGTLQTLVLAVCQSPAPPSFMPTTHESPEGSGINTLAPFHLQLYYLLFKELKAVVMTW